MKRETPKISYTGNSELRTVEGWCCQTCGRFWGDSQHMACWCCATHVPCKDCGADTPKHYTHCDGCRQKRKWERYLKLDAKPYDGSAVTLYHGDSYFFDEDSLLDWLAEQEDDAQPQLVFAHCKKPEWHRSVSEELCDELYEGAEWDTSEIDAQITEWVAKNAPNVYWPSNVRVDDESIKRLMAEARKQ